MNDYLDLLARTAQVTIDSGYYEAAEAVDGMHLSLCDAILQNTSKSVIAEIKAASPSAGVIRKDINAGDIARAMKKGGAVALSVLTEPKQFNGSLEALAAARKAVDLPIMMKDIVLSTVQVYAAQKIGANAVLLIKALFDRDYGEKPLDEMITGVHLLGLEVLLETHTEAEFQSAVKTDADLIGINNRDLSNFKVDLNVTKKILSNRDKKGKLVVSESGIKTSSDIVFLREGGADAFLVGSAFMLSNDIAKKVKEFVNAK